MQERPLTSRPSSRNHGSRSSSPRQKADPADKEALPNLINKLDLSAHNAFEVRTLVWDQLELKLNVVEWGEAKSILGEDLIEANKALKEENLALLSIWKDYSHTTSSIENECQHDFQAAKSPLPEPPNVRDSLFKQISFFLDELSRSSIKESITNPREKIVYEYVTRGALPPRPSTSSTSRDKPTDTRPESARSPPVSPENPANIKRDGEIDEETEEERIERGLKVLQKKMRLDVDSIQKFSQSLKSLLRYEQQLLIKDTEFLQHCLDQQVDYNAQLQKYSKEKSDSSMPSLQEMKEFKSKLEQKYIEMGPRNEKEKRSSQTRSRASPSLSSSASLSVPSSSSSHSLSSSSSHSPSSSSKSLRQSLPSPVTPTRTRTPASLSNTNNILSNSKSENIIHVPHPPKEQRSSDSPHRPRAKLSNVSLSPSSISLVSPSPSSSNLSPSSLPPSSSSSSLHTPSISSTSLSSPSSSSSASPKRTRLKQST